jgi:hypothetical protein
MSYVYTAYASIDNLTTVVFCLYILFIDRDVVFFMKIANFIGMIGSFSLFLVVVESPRWLILNG